MSTIKQDLDAMFAEFKKLGAITCPGCKHYNAILVTYQQDGTHDWKCRDCDYHLIQTVDNFNERLAK